jgi:hypothetical protein
MFCSRQHNLLFNDVRHHLFFCFNVEWFDFDAHFFRLSHVTKIGQQDILVLADHMTTFVILNHSFFYSRLTEEYNTIIVVVVKIIEWVLSGLLTQSLVIFFFNRFYVNTELFVHFLKQLRYSFS